MKKKTNKKTKDTRYNLVTNKNSKWFVPTQNSYSVIRLVEFELALVKEFGVLYSSFHLKVSEKANMEQYS